MLLTAANYQDLTSYDRNKMTGHSLDWSNKPISFKTYQGLKNIKLLEETERPQQNLSDLFTYNQPEQANNSVNLENLSRILRLSHCLTRKEKFGGGYFYFRNVASAGALYPFETYVEAFQVENLEQGLYHHSVADQSITQLRIGDCSELASSAINFRSSDNPVVVFFLSAIFFRSSWKYRDRAFRYHLLDTGHLSENLLLALKCHELKFEISYDFNDEKVNEFIGIDTKREACLATIGVFSTEAGPNITDKAQEFSSVDLKQFSRCAAQETRYAVINEILSLTSKKKEYQDENLDKKGIQCASSIGEAVKPIPFDNTPELMTYSQAILQRRSRRNFIRKPISGATFSWLLNLLREGDKTGRRIKWQDFLSIGVLIADVQGIDPGFYSFESTNRELRLVRPGFLMEEMAHICLDQAWLSNCSSHFLFMSDLVAVEHRLGPRAYRYAMIEAGRMGQRLYLAAESIKFGCCGIGAFYDQEARQFLNLSPGAHLLYLVGLGPLTNAFV